LFVDQFTVYLVIEFLEIRVRLRAEMLRTYQQWWTIDYCCFGYD